MIFSDEGSMFRDYVFRKWGPITKTPLSVCLSLPAVSNEPWKLDSWNFHWWCISVATKTSKTNIIQSNNISRAPIQQTFFFPVCNLLLIGSLSHSVAWNVQMYETLRAQVWQAKCEASIS